MCNDDSFAGLHESIIHMNLRSRPSQQRYRITIRVRRQRHFRRLS